MKTVKVTYVLSDTLYELWYGKDTYTHKNSGRSRPAKTGSRKKRPE